MAAPVLLWLRRDLRLADHPALRAAIAAGPVIPVFILDPETEALGAAARWRLGEALTVLSGSLAAHGSRLILRRGEAAATLARLAAETGATAVHWSRLYAPDWVARDRAVKAALAAAGLEATSHEGYLLNEPWAVETRAGGGFRVFTPFWKTIRPRGAARPLPAPASIPAPAASPASDALADWRLGAGVSRGAAVLAEYATIGEAAALGRLETFRTEPLSRYAEDRDRPDRPGTSSLSENLAFGEISPRTLWHALAGAGGGADAFLRELGWREFAWHLHWQSPELATANWRRDWDSFPWRADNPDAERWRRGQTGEPMVDAGMRELYATGRMHNRVRMLVASYLTKHLLTDWRVGLHWFAECLTDWDPAANALNWQWVAGSGPDAAPYFRVFSPARQAETFDPDGAYRRRFLGNGPEAAAFFAAIPRAWGLSPADAGPAPILPAAEGRRRALAAYAGWRDGSGATTR